jgi:putative transposase
MYRVLGFGRSGFYNWPEATSSPRANRPETIKVNVCQVFEAYKGIYGSKKIAHELRKSAELEKACRKTVAKAMKEMGLKSKGFSTF